MGLQYITSRLVAYLSIAGVEMHVHDMVTSFVQILLVLVTFSAGKSHSYDMVHSYDITILSAHYS